jgi:ribosomal protein S8
MNNRLVDFLVRFQNRRTPKSSSAGNFDLTILSSKVVLKLLNKLSLLKLLKFKVIREDAKDSCLSFSRNLISKLELISTPSRPVSKSHIELLNDAKLKKGGAFYILSNSEFGLLSSLEALERKVGGKLILLVHVC